MGTDRKEEEKERQMDRGEKETDGEGRHREILHSCTQMVMCAHCRIIYMAPISFSIALSFIKLFCYFLDGFCNFVILPFNYVGFC